MVVCGGQGVSDILLNSDPIPAVLRLPVNGVPGNAVHLRLLLRHQGEVVAAGASPGG